MKITPQQIKKAKDGLQILEETIEKAFVNIDAEAAQKLLRGLQVKLNQAQAQLAQQEEYI